MTILRKDINAALALLAEAFPLTFTCEPHLPHKPLKICIDHDIAMRCPVLERRERDAVLRLYTWRVAYLEACVEGATRYDLDGNPAGQVSATDAEYAAAKLATVFTRRKAQLAAVKAAHCAARTAKWAAPRRFAPVTAPEGRAPETVSPPPPPPSRKDSLAALREAARRRKQAALGDRASVHAADQSAQQAAS